MSVDLRDMPSAGAYSLIYADPAWRFALRSEKGRGRKSADHHYPTSPVEALGALPVAQVAAPEAWLAMWTTWPHLQDAFRLAQLWSDPANPWTYRSGGAWAKRPRGWRGDPDKWQFGPGFLFRSACEPLLIFGRGRPAWQATAERNLWVAPIRAHSQKPDAVRDMLRRVVEGPRLEMFANDVAEGFDPWGAGHQRKVR